MKDLINDIFNTLFEANIEIFSSLANVKFGATVASYFMKSWENGRYQHSSPFILNRPSKDLLYIAAFTPAPLYMKAMKSKSLLSQKKKTVSASLYIENSWKNLIGFRSNKVQHHFINGFFCGLLLTYKSKFCHLLKFFK